MSATSPHSSVLPPAVRIEIERRYSEPHRHYHNLHHINACLSLFHQHRTKFFSPIAAELAIWFHDAIYDPTRNDNEQASATLARQLLGCLFPAELDAIEFLILATTHKSDPVQPDARLLTDIDLSILASPEAAFDRYERQIRQEYAHVSDVDFRSGRAKFLKAFLSRPSLYATTQFRLDCESRARSNLRRSLDRLESGAPLV